MENKNYWGLVVEEYEVFSFGTDSYDGRGGFVECALPPLLEVVDGVKKAFGGEVAGIDVDNGDLLSYEGAELRGSRAGEDFAVVGEHAYGEALAVVLHEQTDIAQCVTLAQSCGAEDAYFSGAFAFHVGHGLCQVVGFLLGNLVDEVGALLTHLFGKRIAVADNGCGGAAFGNKSVGCSIATHDGESAVQLSKRKGMGGVIAVGKDDYFLHGGGRGKQ